LAEYYHYQEEDNPTTSAGPIYMLSGKASSDVKSMPNSQPEYYYQKAYAPDTSDRGFMPTVGKGEALASPGGSALMAPELGSPQVGEQPADALPAFLPQEEKSRLSNFLPKGFVPSGPRPPAAVHMKPLPAAMPTVASKAQAPVPLVVLPLAKQVAPLLGSLPTLSEVEAVARGILQSVLQISLPFLPPAGGGYLSLSGGGQAGLGGGHAPLLLVGLLGILASRLLLGRTDGKSLAAFSEVLKPSSALLMPLERPG
jgi:hypothetical protein